jgi:hypothetical protein
MTILVMLKETRVDYKRIIAQVRMGAAWPSDGAYLEDVLAKRWNLKPPNMPDAKSL